MNNITFRQSETLQGVIITTLPADNSTSDIIIKLANDQLATASVPKNIIEDINQNHKALIDGALIVSFNGIAEYKHIKPYKIGLINFTASSIYFIDNDVDAASWMQGFVDCGASGW